MGTFMFSVLVGMFLVLAAIALWLRKGPSDERIQKSADEAIKELHDAERIAEQNSLAKQDNRP